MEKTKKRIYVFLIILPFIDLITSLMSRFLPDSISLGMIVKGLLLLLVMIYSLVKKSKYRKLTFIYYLLIGFFLFFYFFFKREDLSFIFIFSEVTYFLKYFFLLLLLPGYIILFDALNFDNKMIKKVLVINTITYVCLLLIPFLTNSGFNSYGVKSYRGFTGWFYAANEVGAIMVLLLSTSYYILEKNNNFYTLLFLPLIFSLSLIGTKVSLLGTIIIMIAVIIYYLKSNKKVNYLVLTITIFLTTLGCLLSPALHNYNESKEIFGDMVVEDREFKYEKISDVIKNKKVAKFINTITSNRDTFFLRNYSFFEQSDITDKLFGLSFNDRKSINYNIKKKIIEIDFLDIFIHYGIVGIIVYFIPFIYLFINLLKLNKKTNKETWFYITVIILLLCISSIAGHVLSAPAVSMYLVLFIIMVKNTIYYKEPKLIENKITFLCLHLGFGGIETATINNANALSEKYDVEIVSFYSKKNNQAFNVNSKVKIKYLYDGKPNKDEFIIALKDKDILRIFKEGFKSLRILYLKRYLIKNYIENSRSKYIVSTRMEFSKKLDLYGRKDTVKVVQEHTACDKFLYNMYLMNLSNIDYLCALTDSLYNKYKAFNKRVKCVKLPNMLINYPSDICDLKNKNVISISRVDSNKSIDDILRIVSKCKSINKVYIIGDGSELYNVKGLSKELGLSKRVEFTGFLNKEEMEKYILSSSVFLMASKSEALPMALLEAGSYHLPLMAFETFSGTNDIIHNNKNGYVIKNRNINEYSEKLEYLINNSRLKNEFGKASYNESLKYSKENILKIWYDILK